MPNMSFIEELKWRNMIQDFTPGLDEFMAEGMKLAYIGFDPTAKSLGLGNYVQIMILNFLQRAGHKPVVLMGGATGRIGDPSGKDKERELKSYDELEENIRLQEVQLKNLLNFNQGENQAVFVNNYDFYKNMYVLDFLRDVGKNTTINYMLSKESVKKRLETGISYTEFSYQLLQAYDFYCLYKKYDCRIQMGGSDQWGNITAGTEYIGKCIQDSKAFALTTPLLTKSDGKKFGKTEDGNIWLDANLTSPYRFYQFWINCDDADLPKLFRYFSYKSKSDIENLEARYMDDPKSLKKILAEELTIRIHGESAYLNAMQVSELMFNKDCTSEFLKSLNLESFNQLKTELPLTSLDQNILKTEMSVLTFLSEYTQIFSSKSEARRAIQANALSVNKNKVLNAEQLISLDDFLLNRYILVENGKKNKYIIEVFA
jgi:tyrosyl-tRNA synthetase